MGTVLRVPVVLRRPLSAGAALVALAMLAVLLAPAAQAATVKVTFKPSATSFRWSESLWFTGSVKKGTKAGKAMKVELRRQPSGSSTWSTVARTTTTSSGRYSIPYTPSAHTARYFVRVVATSSTAVKRSTVVTVKYTVGGRTLEARATQLGSRLGTAKAKTVRLSATARKAVGDTSVTSVRYRNYTKGMLVEVVRGGKTRTWFVPAKIRDRLVSTGGVRKTFGVPREDAVCTLIDSGCTQQFSKVAAYQSSASKLARYQAGTTRRAQYLAVARSQVGYAEPSWRHSKYNTWVGANNAWCGVFQSWVAAASGNPDLVPRRTTFAGLVSSVKKELVTYKPSSKTHRPRPGTLVFFAFKKAHPKTASHVGVVLSVSGGKVRVIEGNSSKGSVFTDDRGVYIHTRSVSSVLFYAEPDW